MKQVTNLLEALLQATEEERNPNLTNWAKVVHSVDTSHTNGWMYTGKFVKSGKAAVEIEPSVYIVRTTGGTEDTPKPVYRVVTMDENGDLHRTDIWTEGTTPGWALRLRDSIIDLLLQYDVEGLTSQMKQGQVIPLETIELLEEEARNALAVGMDMSVYPDLLLTLIRNYRDADG